MLTMTARRLCLALTTLALVLAGCGGSGSKRVPPVAHLPLVPGAKIVTQVRRCDPGANAYCAWELVVVDPRYRSSDVLMLAERHHLLHQGWSTANAETGEQEAANSPGHRLRVTYATASGDLRGIDLGWIKRSAAVTMTLSQTMFRHTAAMSMLLETGPS
jgi:hypothetical protein